MQLYNKFAVDTRWCCILIHPIQTYTNIENIYDYAVATQERERIVIRKKTDGSKYGTYSH